MVQAVYDLKNKELCDEVYDHGQCTVEAVYDPGHCTVEAVYDRGR